PAEVAPPVCAPPVPAPDAPALLAPPPEGGGPPSSSPAHAPVTAIIRAATLAARIASRTSTPFLILFACYLSDAAWQRNMAQRSVPEDRFTADGEAPPLAGPEIEAIRRDVATWRRDAVSKAYKEVPPRETRFSTWSGVEVPDLVTPADVAVDYRKDLGLPGEYPFTRGVQPTMYRGKLWTMRMFAGFGTPEQTNARFRYLVSEGQTGLSTAFDFPTLMGYDSDSPRAMGEVGMCGVAVDTLRDMEVLFSDIPLDRITTSMTINGPAIVLFSFYVALADQRGIPRSAIG